MILQIVNDMSIYQMHRLEDNLKNDTFNLYSYDNNVIVFFIINCMIQFIIKLNDTNLDEYYKSDID